MTKGVLFSIVQLFFVCFFSFAQKIKEGTFSFLLPETSGVHSAFSYVSDNSAEFFRAINSRFKGNYIECYDLRSGKLKYLVKTNVSEIGSFVKENDTFWLFDSRNREYVLIDMDGTELTSIEESEPSPTDGFVPFFSSWHSNPLVIYNENLYLVASFLYGNGVNPKSRNFVNQGMIRRLNFKTKELTWEGKVTSKAIDFNFGLGHRYTYTKGKAHLIISPVFSSELMIYNLKTGSYYYPTLRVTKYDDISKPLGTWSNVIGVKSAVAEKHYFHNPRFVNILYDEYREQYYRILAFPSMGNKLLKAKILVLNKFLELKYDYDLPSVYRLDQCFVTKEGLNMINFDEYKKNNSVLVFDTLIFE